MDVTTIKGVKIAYRKGTCDEDVIKANFIDNIFLNSIPEYRPMPNDVIIDIGAHIGAFAIAMGAINKCKVYAIEPERQNFEYLSANILSNNLSNVRASKIALTDFKGTINLYLDLLNGSWGDTVVKKVSDQYETVVTDTLANFLEEHKIPKVDFMMCNCEGSEFKIILSTPKEILKRIKIMVILYHLDLVEGYSEKMLYRYLKNCGFSAKIMNRRPKRGWIVAHT